MSRSTVSGPSSSTRVAPALAAAATWACRLPRPNAKSMTSGGRSPRAFVPVAVAVGDDDDERAVGVGFVGERHGDRLDRLGRDQRQVDRDDQDGRRPAGDHVGPCLAQPVIEPVRALAQGPCADRRRVPQDLAIRADHQHVPEAGHGQGGHHGPCQQPLDQIPPFLGVEHLAEPRLGALERADRDDRRDPAHGVPAGVAATAKSRTDRASRARPSWSAMIVSVTSVRKPSAAMSGSRAASTASRTNAVASPR